MLAIRMQRTGRSGHANFRVVVQDSRQTPTSGKVVALIGSYDPHTKTAILEKEKAEFYLKNGARPSNRVARLLKSEGVKLPAWAVITESTEKAIKNPEKLRKNRPEGEEAPEAKAEEPTNGDEADVSEEANTEAEPSESVEGDAAPDLVQTETQQPAEDDSKQPEDQKEPKEQETAEKPEESDKT